MGLVRGGDRIGPRFGFLIGFFMLMKSVLDFGGLFLIFNCGILCCFFNFLMIDSCFLSICAFLIFYGEHGMDAMVFLHSL